MDKYIRINDIVNFHGGWSSDESIIVVNNYTITKNVQVNGSAPLPPLSTGNTLNVNYQMYKSYNAYTQSESTAQPKNLGVSFFEPIVEDTLADVHSYVLANLIAKSFDAEIITVAE